MSSSRPLPSSAQRVSAFVASVLLGAVFVFSAGTKFLAPPAFVGSVQNYGILPDTLALPVATGVTALELALGLMLLLGVGRRFAVKLSIPLIVLFIGLVVYAMRTGLENCGCFAEVIEMKPSQELLLDLVLLLSAGIILMWGEDLAPSGSRITRTVGWSAFLLGGVLFLAGNPAPASTQRLDLDESSLELLTEAEPPIDPEAGDAFVFLFSADCDHCWAFAGAVELMHQRVQDLRVMGLTFSDPQAMAEFRRAFQPSYPIHHLDYDKFLELTNMYPAAIWLQAGGVADSWSGFVPSHREIVESGGYLYATPESESELGESDASAEELFGGPARGRH